MYQGSKTMEYHSLGQKPFSPSSYRFCKSFIFLKSLNSTILGWWNESTLGHMNLFGRMTIGLGVYGLGWTLRSLCVTLGRWPSLGFCFVMQESYRIILKKIKVQLTCVAEL